eukprot:COSAG02_NODE_2954_length_7671_cov_103.987718_4_plen_142_part_00
MVTAMGARVVLAVDLEEGQQQMTVMPMAQVATATLVVMVALVAVVVPRPLRALSLGRLAQWTQQGRPKSTVVTHTTVPVAMVGVVAAAVRAMLDVAAWSFSSVAKPLSSTAPAARPPSPCSSNVATCSGYLGSGVFLMHLS